MSGANVWDDADVQNKYNNLKQRIEKMELPAMPGLEVITPGANALKTIALEPKGRSNNAHVAYNAEWIKKVSGSNLMPALDRIPRVSPEERQTVKAISSEVKAMHYDATKLVEQSEKSITPEDVSDEVGDFITAASYFIEAKGFGYIF